MTLEVIEVYIGQIVGLHSRDNDLPVNPTKAKQLTNIRAAGTDENLILTPHIEHTLEQALEFVEDDELVEVTPKSIRLRKRQKVKLATKNEHFRDGTTYLEHSKKACFKPATFSRKTSSGGATRRASAASKHGPRGPAGTH